MISLYLTFCLFIILCLYRSWSATSRKAKSGFYEITDYTSRITNYVESKDFIDKYMHVCICMYLWVSYFIRSKWHMNCLPFVISSSSITMLYFPYNVGENNVQLHATCTTKRSIDDTPTKSLQGSAVSKAFFNYLFLNKRLSLKMERIWMHNFFFYILFLFLLECMHIQYNFVCLFLLIIDSLFIQNIPTPLHTEPRHHLYSHPDPLPLCPLSKQNRPPRDGNQAPQNKIQ